jgi:biopolymer transport protein ExbD
MIATRRKKVRESPKLDMTPMIDVVFQLLIFFVVTLKQEDILSKLITNRPGTPPDRPVNPEPDQQSIVLSAEGITYGGRPMSLAELDKVLLQRSTYGKDLMVLIKCTQGSSHGLLVQALDLCNKHKLSNLSVLTI